MNENIKSTKVEFYYNWSTNRIAIFCSMLFFLFCFSMCLYGYSINLNTIPLIFSIIFLISSILRGYGLVLSLKKSPSVFYIENNVFIYTTVTGKIKRLPLRDIEEIKKNLFNFVCSQFSIHIISSKLDEDIIVRDEPVNNQKLIEMIKEGNVNCIIDPRINREIGNHFNYKPKTRFQRLSYKPPLFFATFFLFVSALSFFTKPSIVSTKHEELSSLVHRLFCYVTLLPAVLLFVLSFIFFRRNKRSK
jgi:hypothetical protein